MARMYRVKRARCARCRGLFRIRETHGAVFPAKHPDPDDKRITCPGYWEEAREIVLVELPEWQLDPRERVEEV